jgi:predicted permease
MSILHRILLLLYPRSFREEYGEEWVEAALARAERIEASSSFPTLAATLFLLRDTLRELPFAWRSCSRSDGTPHIRGTASSWTTGRVRSLRMSQMFSDLRFALRGLRKNPGFATAAVLTLALGIGANTAVFAVVDGVLLEPLPYPEPNRLAVLSQTDEEGGDRDVPWSVPDLRDVAERAEEVEGVVGYSWMDETLTGLGEAELVYAVGVTDGLLDTFGLQPFLGRDIRAEETLPGAARVALISHQFWTQRLGADPHAVGRALQLSGLSHEIIGVAPQGFGFPSRADFWIGGQWPEESHPRDRHFLRAVGRLPPDGTLERAQAELNGIAALMEEEHPESNRARGIYLQSLTESSVGDARTGLLVLLGAVGMVLLIACANVANLLLARGATRQTEMAVRATLGASRSALLRQLVTESLVLAAAGCGAGLLVALGSLRVFGLISPGRLPRMSNVELDGSVLLFAVLLALLVAGLFGVVPALRLSRASIASAVREGRERDLQTRHRRLFRSGLLTAEVALSLVLLLGAGLLMRSFAKIRSVDLGFQAENVTQFTLTLPPAEYGPEEAGAFLTALEQRIGAIPGVRAVGMNSGTPMGRSHTTISFTIPDHPEPKPGDEPVWLVRTATPGYFRSLGIPVLQGRGIEPSDAPGSAPIVVISETAARRYWPGEDPLGRLVVMREEDPPWTIVGVVGDVRSLDVTTEVEPEAYFPHTQWSQNTMTVEVVQAGSVPGLGRALRETVHAMDPNLPLYWMERLQDRVDESMASDRFYFILIGSFAGLALILASVGLYGVVAYLVSRRTREIGIRLALGAESRKIMTMVLGEGLGPVVAGLGVGLLLALTGGRVLESLLYEVQPLDPLTFVSVPAILLLVALLATALPAWRATRIAPTAAMRVE